MIAQSAFPKLHRRSLAQTHPYLVQDTIRVSMIGYRKSHLRAVTAVYFHEDSQIVYSLRDFSGSPGITNY